MQQKKTIITKGSVFGSLEYLRLLWDYRYLIKTLSMGDVKNRFARTYTGILLSLIQTLIGLGVYWLVFGIGLKVDTNQIPYPLFALPGLIIWQYFSFITNASGGVLFESQSLMSKLYFPRLSFILSHSLTALVDMLAGCVVFVILFFAFGMQLHVAWLYIPLVLLLLIITCLSIAMWLSIISLYTKDISNIIIQITGFLIFVTPVFYPGSIIPEKFMWIMYLNPIAGIIEFTRAVLFHLPTPDKLYLIGFAPILVFLVSGFVAYKHLEKRISDLI